LTSSFHVTVPGQPPSVNHLYETVFRTRPDGTRYKGRKRSDDANNYARDVWGSVRAARPRGWIAPRYQAREGLGLIFIDVYLYLLHEADADNLSKILCDGIKLALNCDDKQFLIRFQHKQVGVKPPRVELEIIPAP
jgi:hypothetical protein